jgi:hypothetical protein
MLRSRVALMHLTALLAFGGDPIPGMSWGGQAFELETDQRLSVWTSSTSATKRAGASSLPHPQLIEQDAELGIEDVVPDAFRDEIGLA